MDVAALLFGHSKALYSTWVFYKPDHLLLDCGEGAATSLGNGGFAIERILLTHGHIDHISGLPSLLWSRAAGMGDTEKPLEIYYPRDDVFVADMQAYLERTAARLPFALRWVPLAAGDAVALTANHHPAGAEQRSQRSGIRNGRRVVAFATRHMRGRLTLGYKIVETRRRLKPEYASLAQAEIRARAQAGGVGGAGGLMEEYEATLVVFSGDTLPLDPALLQGTELLLHEATIIEVGERKHQWHSTLEEAVQVAAQIRPRALVLYHISGRYQTAQVAAAIEQSALRHQIDFPIWCLYRNQLACFWQGGPDASDPSPASGRNGQRGVRTKQNAITESQKE